VGNAPITAATTDGTQKLPVHGQGFVRRKAVDMLGESTLAGLLAAHSEVLLESGCRVWTGAKSAKGYGILKVAIPAAGKPRIVTLLVHWVAWKIWKGDIPTGRGLCHSPELCRSRACFNVAHLRTCTRSENEADKKKTQEARA
jgi:hypothetical protein